MPKRLLVFWMAQSIIFGPIPFMRPVHAGSPPSSHVVVYAASSLTSVLPQIVAQWKARGGSETELVFEATSRLAHQVAAGAPADLFLSADPEWMDYLEKKNLLRKDSRFDLLSNRLVVVVPAGAQKLPRTAQELVQSPMRYFALAGESVPAGKLARMSLQSLGIWSALQDRVVNASNVRGALSWVAKKEADAGVVFATDAMGESQVKVAFEIPETSHPRIIYSAAVLQNSSQPNDTEKLAQFLKGKDAARLFSQAGFRVGVR